MGLFENSYVDEVAARTVLANPAHRVAAQRAAELALVLLRNEGGVLPLKAGAQKHVAVIGALANSNRDTLESWAFAYDLPEIVRVFEGIRSRVGSGATVQTAPGVQLKHTVPSMFEMITISGQTPREPRLGSGAQRKRVWSRGGSGKQVGRGLPCLGRSGAHVGRGGGSAFRLQAAARPD